MEKTNRTEQLNKLKDEIRLVMPELQQMCHVYTKRYPIEATNREVIAAVTVPLSLRAFMVLGAVTAIIATELFEGENEPKT